MWLPPGGRPTDHRRLQPAFLTTAYRLLVLSQHRFQLLQRRLKSLRALQHRFEQVTQADKTVRRIADVELYGRESVGDFAPAQWCRDWGSRIGAQYIRRGYGRAFTD